MKYASCAFVISVQGLPEVNPDYLPLISLAGQILYMRLVQQDRSAVFPVCPLEGERLSRRPMFVKMLVSGNPFLPGRDGFPLMPPQYQRWPVRFLKPLTTAFERFSVGVSSNP